MILYTFQNETVKERIENLKEGEALWVALDQTNLYKCAHGTIEALEPQFTAYKYMADKLAEKTGIFATINGEKIPPLPWWAWYKVDGKQQKPPMSYNMGKWSGLTLKDTYLFTLDVPEEIVLLSDINAFYNCLYGEPCFDYLSEADEKKAKKDFKKRIENFTMGPTAKEAEELDRFIKDTWQNIFTVDGSRRLREIIDIPLSSPTMEKFDVQAVFPCIVKGFVKDIEKCQ